MIKNIKDIAPLLAHLFVDFEKDPKAFETNRKLVADNVKSLGLYNKYIWGLLHDSWVIKTNITSDKFSLNLNDFTTHVFSDALVSKKNLLIDHDKLVFPIHLEFETTSLSFNVVDDDGNIHHIEPTVIDEYLGEQIISFDSDIIEMGLMFWRNGLKRKPGDQILVLMSVKSIKLTEHQYKAWTEIFGSSYDDYYEYFKSQFNMGRYLSDFSLCMELVDEYDNLQNNKTGKV